MRPARHQDLTGGKEEHPRLSSGEVGPVSRLLGVRACRERVLGRRARVATEDLFGRAGSCGGGGERRPMHILNRKSWSTIEMREAEIERARFLRGTSVYSIRFGVL